MRRRKIGATAYTLTYDAENRLAVVTNTVTGEVTRFVYDGDGNRVLRIDGSGTTVTIGDYYEKQGNVIRKYYYAGGQRIAVRVGGVVYYLHSDHLGSATLTTDLNGNRVGELRYTPYGVTRYEWGSTPTNRRYTGQRWEGAMGLYDYHARFYDPALGRFVSPDVLVPNPAAPQSLNRYAYVLNNPLRYTDPSGRALCEDADCEIRWRQRSDGSYQPIGLFPPGVPFDARDLTYYLYALINNNVDSPQILAISSLNTVAGINPVLGGFHIAALWGFASLVGTDKVWDVKDQIEYELGEVTRLCHAGGCVWVDYSTVGNIHFGFLAERAGFANWETHLGASYAEITDPDHDGAPYQIIHLNVAGRTVRGYFNPAYASAAFDDPKDRNAINFGQALYRTYGLHPTLRQIQALMTDYADTFALVSPPGGTFSHPEYPYRGDYFDHP